MTPPSASSAGPGAASTQERTVAAVAGSRSAMSIFRGRTRAGPVVRRRLRRVARRAGGVAALRAWNRRGELGLVALAVLAGAASGLVAALMGNVAAWLHVALFGPGAELGLSALRNADPLLLLLVPTVGGLLLSLLNQGLARWWPRPPLIDPIEANALHGGRMSLSDGVVVGAQNLVSNGFGASVGLEAAYTQTL